jgi:hypothetical protein
MSAGQTPSHKEKTSERASSRELMNKRRTENVGLMRDLQSGA